MRYVGQQHRVRQAWAKRDEAEQCARRDASAMRERVRVLAAHGFGPHFFFLRLAAVGGGRRLQESDFRPLQEVLERSKVAKRHTKSRHWRLDSLQSPQCSPSSAALRALTKLIRNIGNSERL